ncbi:MAG TPA: hypothetical protein VN306_16735, partial [Mycobacterium sp.]|nr:hypothetical protein [Mycobacterium sp.]
MHSLVVARPVPGHLFAHELPAFVCALGCVEEEKFHDVLRVVLGLEDVSRSYASLLPRGRAAGEVQQPRVEVGNPVLDVQDGHGPVLHNGRALSFP